MEYLLHESDPYRGKKTLTKAEKFEAIGIWASSFILFGFWIAGQIVKG